MKKNPKVSIIVPTYNSEKTLETCLKSIKAQSYTSIELIIVDNHSKDSTLSIAKKYSSKVFSKGPERSSQRNYAAKKASGEYVVFIDSDMKLTKDVIKECVSVFDKDTSGVIIPEESFGGNFWAECKRLERSFYVGVDWMEAARFFKKSLFNKVKGYDENLVSGEDWDLSQRVEEYGKLRRIESYIYHDEGNPTLLSLIRKKYYYAQKFSAYVSKGHKYTSSKQTGILARYMLFFIQPSKLIRKPMIGIGMLFMKSCEFGAGAFGYVVSRYFSHT